MKRITLIAAALAFAFSPLMAQSFTPGDVFISSSLTDEVRIYDSNTLAFKSSFTHPEFVKLGGYPYQRGPNGLAFNSRGNLVVAAYESFVEFSAPGVEFAIYPKTTIEANETLLFDNLGNLYTTTSTGGSDKLNQYSATGYIFAQTISLPVGAGQLTGITFDDQNRLFVASQSDRRIHVLQADPAFTTFTFSHSITSANLARLEGLQINQNGELVAGGGNLTRYNRDTGAVLGSFDAPNDYFPVPVTVDNAGSIFTADFENGTGTAPADIFKFAADGSSFITINDPGLYGPFGLAIAGTSLPGGPNPNTCEDPTPHTQGYWHRQCLGVPAFEGGIDPGRNGRGPQSPTEPLFVEELMLCADDGLEDLGFYGLQTCEGMDADPPNDACERAEKHLTALILNVCADRLQHGCEVDVGTEGCSSTNIVDLIEEIGTRIFYGDCQVAGACAAAVNEGTGLVIEIDNESAASEQDTSQRTFDYRNRAPRLHLRGRK